MFFKLVKCEKFVILKILEGEEFFLEILGFNDEIGVMIIILWCVEVRLVYFYLVSNIIDWVE